jgi:hypothetical protein
MRGDAGRWGLANDSPGGAASSRSRSTYEVGKSCIGAAGLPRRPCECSPSVGEPGADICFVQYLVVPTRFGFGSQSLCAHTPPHVSQGGGGVTKHISFSSLYFPHFADCAEGKRLPVRVLTTGRRDRSAGLLCRRSRSHARVGQTQWKRTTAQREDSHPFQTLAVGGSSRCTQVSTSSVGRIRGMSERSGAYPSKTETWSGCRRPGSRL